MLAVIRDFLLEPALLTTGLLLLPAFALLLLASRWRRAQGKSGASTGRLCLGVIVGGLVSVVAILILFSATVLSGHAVYQLATWFVLAITWGLVAYGIARLGRPSWLLGALLSGAAFALDTWVTVAILFE
jgi:hypothetical protein